MATPISHEQLYQQLHTQLSKDEQPLLAGFLEQILPEMAQFSSPQGRPACWCDPSGFLAMLRFLIQPVQEGEIQVHIHHQQGEGANGLPDGIRLFINLPDTPFVLDAVRSFLKQSGRAIYALTHRVLNTRRDAKRRLLSFTDGGAGEMLLVALIESYHQENHLPEMEQTLLAVLQAVRHSVEDFPPMREVLLQEAAWLDQAGHQEEGRFLSWLLEDNFVFMGLRSMTEPDQQEKSALGLFRNSSGHSLGILVPGLMEEVEQILRASQGELLTIDYCRHGRSIIYASDGVDFFAVRRPDGAGGGNLLLVLGRFSRTALANRASAVPILARQAREILSLSGFERDSSAYYEFRSLFDRMPLRELFYSQPAVVAGQIREILRLQGDTQVRVMSRAGRFGHYGAVLCAFFQSRFRPGIGDEVAMVIARCLQRKVAAVTVAGTNTRSFIVCYVEHDPTTPFEVEIPRLREEIQGLILTWMDRLYQVLSQRMSPASVQHLLSRHSRFADARYQGAMTPLEAALDLTVLEEMASGTTFACRLMALTEGRFYLRLYGRKLYPLATMLRLLDHLAVVCHHEFTCSLPADEHGPRWISRYEVELPVAVEDPLAIQSLLEETLAAVVENRLADDPLNRLALLAGLCPRQLILLVALRQYALQVHPHLATTAINRAMLTHVRLSRLLVEGFASHFSGEDNPWQIEFDQALSQVTLLADDQIWHVLKNLVTASLRTNAFVHPMPEALAIKVDPGKIINLAPPCPWREIFVYAPGLEGIHLRGGPVARGGIRHSDRLDDYRREVLGLMQTQRVKNSIIVPDGAKGGFVLTHWEQIPPSQRAAEISRRYQQYIQALLSITDNVVQGKVVSPVVALDGADPYLVVAADKGTASFSDLANRLAIASGFWLGDAFASGGSRGYNHKSLGITARGAWQCIRLHFQEMGHDLEQEGISVVAIGDMAGDVFGNGMLVTPMARLVAAFNHQHIFLDPNPDPQASYQERHRLFQLPASTWLDYRQEVISAGGGVFSRTAKAISLSPEVRQRLAIQESQLSGEALVRAVLKAPVDLLYNGGIGTYIKSSSESHAMVGDKANDAVRVDATEVGAKVIAEGGNLGITRLGRLELARPRGGLPPVRLNSDAVDNSGGVDLSDHEVNLKILFHWLQQQGLLNEETRDHLMVALAPEVVKSVLADNHAQHLAISRDVPRSQSQGELYLELLDYLVEHAGLDPQVEAIPARDELQRMLQAGEGWPRPLLAILLGYAKIHVKGQVLASSLPDLPFSAPFLRDYFPPSLMDRFAEQVAGHFLRREIIAAAITNHMINHTGLGLLFGVLLHHTQQGISQWVQGWLLSDYLLDGATYRQEPVQGRLEEAVMALAGNLSHHPWLVLDESQLEPWRQTIRTMLPCLWEMLPQLVGPEKYAALLEEQQQLVARGVKAEMASCLCLLPSLGMVPDLMAMASQGGPSLLHLVAIQWQLEDHFGLDWLEERLPKVRNRDKWGLLTVAHTRRQLQQCRWRLVERVALSYPDKEPALACLAFIQSLGQENEDYLTLLTQARRQEHLDLLPLTVLVAELREMV